MNIKYKFTNLDFLSEESIEKSKEILKETFLIDFYDTYKLNCDYFINLLAYEEKKLYDREIEEIFKLRSAEQLKENNEIKDREEKDHIENEKILFQKMAQDANNKIMLNAYKKIDLEEDIDNGLEIIHSICKTIMGDYMISVRDYLPHLQEQGKVSYWLDNYIFDNVKMNICLFNEFIKFNKEEIGFSEAVKEYKRFRGDFYEPNIKRGSTKKNTEETIEKNLRKKLLKFREKEYNSSIEKNFYNYEKEKEKIRGRCIYKLSSNLYLYTIDNYSICKYYDRCYKKKTNVDNDIKVEKIENNTTHSYSSTIKFIHIFLENNVNFMDLYLFERIYNNSFILYMYNAIQCLKNIEDKNNILKVFFPLIYLPNIFDKNNLMLHLLTAYMNEYHDKLEEFQNGIEKFCFAISFYLIPLYNMIFENLLGFLCNVKNIDLKEFGDNYAKKNISNIKKGTTEIYNILKQNEIPIGNDDQKKCINQYEFKIININVSEKLDFELFQKNNIIKFLGSFDKEFVNIINNKEKYIQSIKKFILNVSY